MPPVGVQTTTSTLTGRTTSANEASATYFVAGQSERGPIDQAVPVHSLQEFVTRFGGRVAYGALFDDLKTHFEEGGVEAVVCRVVGPAKTFGTLMLQDRAGTPANTLAINAADPGAFSTRLTVQVANGSISGTFTVTVRLDGVVVETWNDIPTPADAVVRLAQSLYVRAVNQGSATAAPNNNPAVLAATALSAGADDRASITSVHVLAALELANDAFGTGVVATPGYASSVTGTGLLLHAKAHSRVAFLAVAVGTDAAGAKSAAANLVGDDGSEFAALFYPGVLIPDGVGSRTVTPEGYVAAKRAQAIVTYGGPWQAGAGEISQADYVLGPEVQIDATVGNDLNDNYVSAIRPILGATRVYGWRSLSSDVDNYASLTARDTLNLIVVAGLETLEQFVFRTVDGQRRLLSQADAALTGIVDPIAVAGGLFPSDVDPGYRVDVGESLNTLQVLQQNKIIANVAARPSPTAQLILLQIVKAPLSASI